MTPSVAAPDPGRVEDFRRKHRTGLVTLLFTDMVGSTALKQQLGDRAAAELFRKHHEFIRQMLQRFPQAEEIETAGDSFMLIFATPSDAAQFALLIQERMRSLSHESQAIVRDRIGIHLGEVVVGHELESRKPRDLFGIQIDTCARVMSLAGAGQVLMTRAVFDSARQVLKGEDIPGVGPLEWLNHGPYVLKGLEEPVEICEVREAGQQVQGPPPNSEKAQRKVSAEEEPVLGWRPALGQVVPHTEWGLEKKLGEGGFGEVWLGQHQKLKERRVFKFCFRADRVRSLKREVTLFRVMKEKVGYHPNIVGIQEVFFDQPPYYIVMDYAEGWDLRAWCEAQGGVYKVPVATRLEIVAQVADALQAAHEAGVIHRDVKPSNILISNFKSEIPNPRPQVKLTDFGIGQVVSQEALAGITKGGFTQTMLGPGSSSHTGTQLYMAPELMAGHPASIGSDIYSLGVVLYQLLVGDFSRPLTTDWAKRVADSLLRQDLEKCFAGDAHERFAGAGNFAKNLRSVERRRSEWAVRERSALRQKQLKRAIAVMSVLAAVVGLLVLAVQLTLRQKGPAASAAKAIRIAVVPFVNENTNQIDEYFSDSLTAELINGLRTVPGFEPVRPDELSVTARTEELRRLSGYGIGFLVEGSVQWKEGKVRIIARLTETTGLDPIVLTNHDCAPKNLLGVPNDLTLRIAEGISKSSQASLSAEVQKQIEQQSTKIPDAYDNYLRGRFDLKLTRTRPVLGTRKAIPLLEQAIQLDAGFAVAYAELARACVTEYYYSKPEERGSLEKEAWAAIQRAQELGPNLPETHLAAGFFFWTPSQHWQREKAIREYRAALALRPNWDEVYDQLTAIYLHGGLLEQGYELAKRLADNYRLDPHPQYFIGNALFWKGDYEKAVQTWRGIPVALSGNFIMNSYQSVALIHLDRTNEAVDLIEKALKSTPLDKGGSFTSVQAILLAKQGNKDGAIQKIMAALEQRKGFGHFHHTLYNIASAYALLKQPEPALTFLWDAATNGFPCYELFKADPNLANLHGQKGFEEFLAEQKKVYEKFKKEFGETPFLGR